MSEPTIPNTSLMDRIHLDSNSLLRRVANLPETSSRMPSPVSGKPSLAERLTSPVDGAFPVVHRGTDSSTERVRESVEGVNLSINLVSTLLNLSEQ